jgi:assimilatory nitrate reductase catalytic subunit
MLQTLNQNKTTCPYCGVGCGIELSRDASGALAVKGDQQHPANFGKLCSKGSTLAQTLVDEGRLLQPMIHGIRAQWDHAIEFVANKFTQIIQQHGPDAVAFYVSGQLLTEDYYVANKLMKGFIGSANIDTNSRLCMSSAVAAYKRAFGEDSVPGCYEDLEQADLIVLTGSNTAWCHPILFQRIKAAKLKRPSMKVVVIDPRQTASCEIADLHLAIKPGADIALYNGLLAHLADNDKTYQHYITQFCKDFENALSSARQDAPSLEAIARQCELPANKIEQFYEWFAETDKTVTCFSQGINQSSQGTDKGNAIINCHLATGRVGKPGASPFSLTGQPNAMGGREVGGLSNQLAAHMEFVPSDIEQVSAFWGTKNIATQPGLKAVDLFQAIEEGTVKAVWIMGTNPVVSLPNADQIVRALNQAELVVVSDCIANTDTAQYAHVLLPATGWSEKDGTVTNSERCISRQRGIAKPAGEARQDWRILTDVARAMGFTDHFTYTHAADVFREHAALSAIGNQGQRQFNIAPLSNTNNTEYDQLQPIQWPINKPHGQAPLSGQQRLYADGLFSTADKKAQFIAVRCHGVANKTSARWPLALNTGRIRDQWHTMTRTALAPSLNAHKSEPFVEVNPQTAEQFGLHHQGYARVSTQWGNVLLKVDVTNSIRPNELFVPMHWNDQWARNARIGSLVNPVVDPISGQPESKHTPCTIEDWQPQWSALLLSRHSVSIPKTQYAVKVRGQHFYRYELAGAEPAPSLDDLAQTLASQNHSATLCYQDKQRGQYRGAWLSESSLDACIYIGSGRTPFIANADRGWLTSLFSNERLEPLERKALLSGKSPAGVEDCGRTVCACFGVGEKTILKAIKEHNLKTAADVGKRLKAGTNCGSCVAEIKALF